MQLSARSTIIAKCSDFVVRRMPTVAEQGSANASPPVYYINSSEVPAKFQFNPKIGLRKPTKLVYRRLQHQRTDAESPHFFQCGSGSHLQTSMVHVYLNIKVNKRTSKIKQKYQFRSCSS